MTGIRPGRRTAVAAVVTLAMLGLLTAPMPGAAGAADAPGDDGVLVEIETPPPPGPPPAADDVASSTTDGQVAATGTDPQLTEALGPPQSTWDVDYSGFTPQAEVAVQHAVDIWAAHLSSPVPIRVDAEWCDCGGLARGGPWVTYDPPGAPHADTWYPYALADAVAGSDQQPGAYDLSVTFNGSYAHWYTGTDGSPPADEVDLVTTALHEIGHGLGYVGSLQGDPSVGSSQASWGLAGDPVIWDRFVEDGSGTPVIDPSLPNPGTELQGMLTGDDLWFTGPATVGVAGAPGARLWAPDPESPSAYSHLHESIYPPASGHSLMTPGISWGEAYTVPDQLTLAILADLGWSVPTPGSQLRVTTDPAVGARVVVDGVPRNDWGLDWVGVPPGSREVCFTDVVGAVAPPCETVDVAEDETGVVEGGFTRLGVLKVEIDPAGLDGTIFVDGVARNDYGLYSFWEPGEHEVCFSDLDDWATPGCRTVNVTAGELTTTVGTYTDDPGADAPAPTGGRLRVTSDPPVPTRISVDGVHRSDWGLDGMRIDAGAHEVCFSDVPGFSTPACRTVTVPEDGLAQTSGTFEQLGLLRVTVSPAGLPSDIVVDGLPRNQYGMYAFIEPGTHEVCWTPVAGYDTPVCQQVEVTAGNQTDVTGSFVATAP